jgi:carboxypeptidase PM20D1
MPQIIIILIAVIVLIVIAIIMMRAARFPLSSPDVEPAEPIDIDGNVVADHLSQAVQFRTVSYPDPEKFDRRAFQGFMRLLERLYPRVHATLERMVISDYSLLYTWKGSNLELDPVMLTAHYDVVPADEGEKSGWDHQPFSGDVADGYVWGRGTLDVKIGVIGVLESIEHLLKEGFKPERTILLGFGHDEEIGGKQGARQISAYLAEKGVRLYSLLDEGGGVTQNIFQGIQAPVAAIGVAEKGYLSLQLSVEQPGGHSALPPAQTAIGILSLAIARLEANPFPASMKHITNLFRHIGADAPMNLQIAMANQGLFGKSIRRRLEGSPFSNAISRTTMAVTMINGGVKDNILPRQVSAVVNCRILPGDDIRKVYEYIRGIVNDERVEIKPLTGDMLEGEFGWNPSAVSPTDSDEFILLDQTIRQTFPGAATAPFLVFGATDARYYYPVCTNVFRFCPYAIDAKDLSSVHGVNEKISIDSCATAVSFFIRYLQLTSG